MTFRALRRPSVRPPSLPPAMRSLPEPTHMTPYYFDGIGAPLQFEPLTEDLRCDLAIVGGGVTGLSAALHAARRGLKVVLLEARTVCWAASGRNAGYMIPYVDYDPSGMTEALGPTAARHYWQLAHEAVAYLPELVKELGIDCDLQRGLLMAARKPATWERLQRTGAEFSRDYGLRNVDYPDEAAMQSLIPQGRYVGGLLHKDVPTLHPVKLVYGLLQAAHAAGVRFHEHTEVTGYEETAHGVRLKTDTGASVQADTLLLACNAYGGALAPSLQKRFIAMYTNMIGTAPLSVELARSVLSQPVAVLEAEAATSVVYRMTPDRRLLFGAGGPFVGRDGKLVKKLLTRELLAHFPTLEGVAIPHVWGGWFGMTAFSDTPDIGRLSARVHYAQAIPVVWAVSHGRLLAEALTAPGSSLAQGYGLLADITIPPGPGGTLLSESIRVVADTVAKVRAVFA